LSEDLESVEDSLEELTLNLLDLSLRGPMLMSSESLLITLELDIAEEMIKRFLFAIFLLGATIQDGGKKERSMVTEKHGHMTLYQPKERKSKIKEKSN